ncbi:alpha/beta hydrolase family protein [Lutibacter sp.]|uniref:alpha/beta hydrolase family protein n=1 Tax=Lutibacter sp. TaxID=1925666 RepID=UPI00356608D9
MKKTRFYVQFIVSFFLLILSTTLNAQLKDKKLVELLNSSIYVNPKVYWKPEMDRGSVKALFYETLQYKGKQTRTFAYIGIPKSDKPVPAMILVHGGGGKAFYEWVKIWNDRGYAAISMSLEGHKPDLNGNGKYSHEFSGPVKVGRFDDVELPIEDQWMYHAVSDIMIAHTLLANLPEVDANKIGITGISWGGVLSSLVSGIDNRLKCAIPVYGAGFLYESKGHFGDLRENSPQILEKKKFWDPAKQFINGNIPTLWVNGDSDAHFSLNITSKSFNATKNHALLSIHPKMLHGHKAGWNPKEVPEIYAFADNILMNVKPGLGKIVKQPSKRRLKLKYKSEIPIKEATIYYLNNELTYAEKSTGIKNSSNIKWLNFPVKVNNSKKEIRLKLPKEVKTYYVNLKDARGYIISSVLVEL